MSNNSLKHLAIIMDGNGRWAQVRSLPRIVGHRQGAVTVKNIITKISELEIPYLTLYAFSSENWKRPLEEINELLYLIEYYLLNELDNLIKNKIKLKIIGDLTKFPQPLIDNLLNAEKLTSANHKLTLQIALNYGGRQEIINGVRKIIESNINIDDIDENSFSRFLYNPSVPDPDLLIRTSGEKRISNFLVWQIAYSELYFTDTLWPDFTTNELELIIEEFKKRSRRYGAI